MYYFKQSQNYQDGVYLPYIISSFGRIFSINYHMMQDNIHEMVPCENSQGYLHLILNYNGTKYMCRMNRLVAISFIKNRDFSIYKEVNHKNGIKSENYVWNLEWVTPKENIQHARKNGLSYQGYGELSNNHKYCNDDIKKVCKLLEKNKLSYSEISKITHVSYDTISNIMNGRQWISISNNYNLKNNSHYNIKRHKK